MGGGWVAFVVAFFAVGVPVAVWVLRAPYSRYARPHSVRLYATAALSGLVAGVAAAAICWAAETYAADHFTRAWAGCFAAFLCIPAVAVPLWVTRGATTEL